ncbi:MAG TPA: proteasome activator [Acidimicrobiales bacterium]|jgi:hypothetical protein|nr:DUF2587 domain-containing protein [Acidimicrobiales bacterium]MDP6215135.1 DUF2587 domain-containing protein [Acidimicrobiales bacterium]MDP7210024.1 DUF2587 domain-containing protein [Acidimicrobiales bacterium]HJL89445.1 proteasome activator [Acidimicrobiales bacterium]HJO98570.1 proteasome activator [Acidimicrobiales bacterium]|tara:strand:+ start:3512 stop:4021 length:510 start_codon:yes stop_codon:yes gene_type:complete
MENQDALEPEVMTAPSGDAVPDDGGRTESAIEQPAKVMRVGTMMRQLLEEVRAASLDEASRGRLREIFETSVDELGSALSEELSSELDRLILPFGEGEAPSSDELRIAQAQLVGWLEGLIQGIQATLFAQQMAAQQQLAGMRHDQLGPGNQQPMSNRGPGGEPRPGTYL